MSEKNNIVKYACSELGITQKELAEKLGVSKPSVERWAQSGDVPEQGKIQIEMMLENLKLKNELSEIKTAIGIIAKYSK